MKIPISYNGRMFREVAIGDVVRMRKAHPCGGTDWKVVRLGADIGLECLTCQHRIMLSRRDLEHRIKSVISEGSTVQTQK